MVAMPSATHTQPTTRLISPARSLRGSLTLPGDKSISHRYAMLAGFASGTSRLTNFSTGADPHSSLACMAAMGAKVRTEGRSIEVTGTAGKLHQPPANLDCGNSGSTMRMLSGLVAAQPGTFRFIGDESLTKRPMERIGKPLEQMGARVSLTDGHAPMTIHGSQLHAIDFEAPIASAQVKTAVLFAGLQANGTTSFAETVRTRDHTEHALRAFGAELLRRDDRLYIAGGQQLHAIDATVPGDISSAAFFLCAALLFEDSNLVLDALGMNPTRASLLDVITTLGGQIKVLDLQDQHGEMLGRLRHPALVCRHHEQHAGHRADAGQHVRHEPLVAWHVHEGQPLPVRQRRPGEPEVDGHPAGAFLRPAIRLHSRQGTDERGLSMVDVTGGRDDMHGQLSRSRARPTARTT